MLREIVFRVLFGASFTCGLGFVGWKGVSDLLGLDGDRTEFDRIYDGLTDYYDLRVKGVVEEINKEIDRLNTSCKTKIEILIPNSISKAGEIKAKLTEEDKLKEVTKKTFGYSLKNWAQILRDNLNDSEGLINYTGILKKACQVESSTIVLELGYVPKAYRLFRWTGIEYGTGFKITNEKFKHLLYGAIEGEYQTTNDSETTIEGALSKIS